MLVQAVVGCAEGEKREMGDEDEDEDEKKKKTSQVNVVYINMAVRANRQALETPAPRARTHDIKGAEMSIRFTSLAPGTNIAHVRLECLRAHMYASRPLETSTREL